MHPDMRGVADVAPNNQLMKGLAIGFGIAVLTPLVIAALAPVLQPAARSALKAGIRVYEKGRESLELLGETVDDIVAEVHEDMHDAATSVEEVSETLSEAAGDTDSVH